MFERRKVVYQKYSEGGNFDIERVIALLENGDQLSEF